MYLAHSFMSHEKRQKHQQPLVLAVENHDDSLLLMSYTLELLGCRFICQKDGLKTLLAAKEYQPDLILLDIFLPGMSGLDIVKYLKQESLTHHIPVVAVTVLAGREDQAQIFQAGFDDYISKPYMIEELAAIMGRLLGREFNPSWVLEICQE